VFAKPAVPVLEQLLEQLLERLGTCWNTLEHGDIWGWQGMIQDSRPSLSGMLKVGLQDERKLSALLWSGFLGPFSVNLALIGVTPMDLEAQIPNKHLQTNPNDMFSNKQ
jgi:hypothetical protein